MNLKDLFKKKEKPKTKPKKENKNSSQDGEGDNVYIIADFYGEPLDNIEFIEISKNDK